MHLSALSEREKESSAASETREVLEKQMEMHREQHQKQLQSLRDKIAEKQATVDDLKEYVFFFPFYCGFFSSRSCP